jgi:hypothetical protein
LANQIGLRRIVIQDSNSHKNPATRLRRLFVVRSPFAGTGAAAHQRPRPLPASRRIDRDACTRWHRLSGLSFIFGSKFV